MTDLRTAAQQALEALESTQLFAAHEHYPRRRVADTLDALRAALEQPYAEQAHRVEQETHGRMRINPVNGDVSIGTPTEQPDGPCPTCVALARTVMMDQMGTA